MKNIGSILITGATALLLAGCETDGLSNREQHNSYAAMINSAYRSSAVTKTNTPVIAPMQLAVAQIGEVAPQTTFVTELSKQPALVRRVVSLPMPGDQDNNNYRPNGGQTGDQDKLANEVESVRNLSRDSGAPYLLLVGGSVDSYTSQNVLSVFDCTIVGGALLPGTTVNSDGKAAGALIDVSTGRILFLVNAQVQKSGLSPDFFTDGRRHDQNNQLRDELLSKLATNFLDTLAQQTATNLAAR